MSSAHPLNEVTLDSFEMTALEITRGEMARVMKMTMKTKNENARGKENEKEDAPAMATVNLFS